MTGVSNRPDMLATVPVSGDCESHGPWAREIPAFLADTIPRMCPVCAKEKREAEEREAAEVERQRREAAQLAERDKRLAKAGIGERHKHKTFAAFVADTPELADALENCRALAEDVIEGRKSAPSLIMIGNTGTGKSHLGCSLVIATCDAGKDARRLQASEIIRKIKASWLPKADYTEQEAIDYFGEIDLLVVEEIGVQFGSDTERMYLFEVVNKRYEACLPTVLISNLDMDALKKEVGERVVDRLREDGGRLLRFTGQSWRAGK